MTTLAQLFADMDAQVGIVEDPPHTNIVHLADGDDLWRVYYGRQPPTAEAAWCALFQSAMETRNHTPLPAIDFHGGFVGVDAGRAWFDAHGLIEHVPVEGYLAFYKEHVGRVRVVHDADHWLSLEGNEGDGVRLVERSKADLVGGFGVRHYQVPPQPPQEDDVPPFIISTDAGHTQKQLAEVNGRLVALTDGSDVKAWLDAGAHTVRQSPATFDIWDRLAEQEAPH